MFCEEGEAAQATGAASAVQDLDCATSSISSDSFSRPDAQPLKTASSAQFQVYKKDLEQRVGLGLMERKDGLAVVSMAPEGLAAMAGVRIGFKIVSINGRRVTSVSEANKILSMTIGNLVLEALLPQRITPKEPPKRQNVNSKPMLKIGPPDESVRSRIYMALSSRNKIAAEPTCEYAVRRAVYDPARAMVLPSFS
jgi:hypothetical protein